MLCPVDCGCKKVSPVDDRVCGECRTLPGKAPRISALHEQSRPPDLLQVCDQRFAETILPGAVNPIKRIVVAEKQGVCSMWKQDHVLHVAPAAPNIEDRCCCLRGHPACSTGPSPLLPFDVALEPVLAEP